jgi:hypothetical protein
MARDVSLEWKGVTRSSYTGKKDMLFFCVSTTSKRMGRSIMLWIGTKSFEASKFHKLCPTVKLWLDEFVDGSSCSQSIVNTKWERGLFTDNSREASSGKLQVGVFVEQSDSQQLC